jgi:hypothetical protein
LTIDLVARALGIAGRQDGTAEDEHSQERNRAPETNTTTG